MSCYVHCWNLNFTNFKIVEEVEQPPDFFALYLSSTLITLLLELLGVNTLVLGFISTLVLNFMFVNPRCPAEHMFFSCFPLVFP